MPLSLLLAGLCLLFAPRFAAADPPGATALPRLAISDFAAPPVPYSGNAWKSYLAKTGAGLQFCFRLRLPSGPAKRLVVYLDGSLSGGGDNLLQMGRVKLNRFLADVPGALVLVPQAPADLVWDSLRWQSGVKLPTAGTQPRDLLGALVSLSETLSKRYGISAGNRTIIGYSLGAFGALDSLLQYPQAFGTVVALAGLSDPTALAERAGQVRVRLFHGAKDTVVDPEYSRAIYAAMQAKQGDCRLYVLADKGHDIVDAVVALPEFRRLFEAESP